MANLEPVKGKTNLYKFKQDPRLAATAEAELLFQAALAAEEKPDKKTALKLYNRAIGLNPNSADAWINIGTIWLTRKNNSEAERCYRKAIEAEPNYPLAYFNLANVFEEYADTRKLALEYYLMALELDPRYGAAHFNIALLYSKQGANTKAIQHFREFLKYGTEKRYLNSAAQEIQRLRAKLRKTCPVFVIPAKYRSAKARAGTR